MLVNCKNCQKEFNKAPSEIKRFQNNFCTKSCSATFNNRLYPKRGLEGKCLCCQKAIRSALTYCSQKCLKKSRKPGMSKEERVQKLKGYVVSYRQRMKLKALEYKGGKCEKCGYNKSIRSLVFHHLDPTQKDFSLSTVTRNWDIVKIELDKCILVCANCHGEIHEQQYLDKLGRSDSNT